MEGSTCRAGMHWSRYAISLLTPLYTHCTLELCEKNHMGICDLRLLMRKCTIGCQTLDNGAREELQGVGILQGSALLVDPVHFEAETIVSPTRYDLLKGNIILTKCPAKAFS